jgi:predicted RNase H-like HicB family nuclease
LCYRWVALTAILQDVHVADAPSRAEPEQLTIVIEPVEDGWWMARIEGTEAISQGRTREEARRNVLSALHDLVHEPTLAERLLYRLRALRADLRDLLPTR